MGFPFQRRVLITTQYTIPRCACNGRGAHLSWRDPSPCGWRHGSAVL